MLRCGQMLVANTLLKLYIGEDWSTSPRTLGVKRRVISLLGDDPSCPYSIHQLTLHGHVASRSVGAWLGPGAMAHVLQVLLREQLMQARAALACEVARDAMLSLHDIEESVVKEDGVWKPLLLLIPLRLGLDALLPQYIDSLKKVFSYPECAGMLGGRPNLAYYFIGVQGQFGICFDPHTTQSVVDMTSNPSSFSVDSYTCTSPKWVPLNDIDPSLCLAFFLQTREELHTLCGRLREDMDPKYPLLSIVQDSAAAVSGYGATSGKPSTSTSSSQRGGEMNVDDQVLEIESEEEEEGEGESEEIRQQSKSDKGKKSEKDSRNKRTGSKGEEEEKGEEGEEEKKEGNAQGEEEAWEEDGFEIINIP